MSRMPRHVQAKLIDEGVITEKRLTRRTQRRRCPRGCGATLLACHDMGLEIWCDPWPITAKGEFLALLAGRATYRHVMGELDRRFASDIEWRSADHEDVLVAHTCGLEPPEINQARIAKYAPHDTSGEPPF